MATSKTKGKTKRRKKKNNATPWIIGIVVLVALALAPRLWSQYQIQTATGDFAELIREGRKDLNEKEETYPDIGRTHVAFGTELTFNSSPPTSGPHYGAWVNPNFYSSEQEAGRLVHSLEHGHVVAYYGDVSDEVLDTLDNWTRRFPGDWDGFIATPMKDIGEAVVLTAWRHTLRLDPFDPALAAAFIDKYRGRGPENKVR